MARRQQHFLLRGGLDMVSSTLAIPNGRLISVSNYESADAGYERVGGYERFDGRPSPSGATYRILDFDGATRNAAAGDTLTGVDSGASAPVLAVVAAMGGATGYYVLGDIAGGPFEDDEELRVGSDAVGDADGTATENGAASVALHENYTLLAANRRRAAIQAVPGSGPVRGVWEFEGQLLAFRDNANGTGLVMHRATADGWEALADNYRVRITQARVEPRRNARIREVRSGTPTGAEGILIEFHVTSGTAQEQTLEGLLTFRPTTTQLFDDAGDTSLEYLDSGSWTAFAGGIHDVPSPITVPAGGRYEFRNYNFGGQADNRRMYAVNGVSRAFEWDGESLFSLDTGHSDDRPTHLAIHANHLMLAYRGGSVQLSATGDPRSWEAGDGAAEIATGQEIHGLLEGVALGNTVILGENTIQALYGDIKEDFVLRTHSGEDSGAIEWTGENMGSPVYLDNRGLRSLETTDRYGNFTIGTLTYLVQPWIETQRRAGVEPTASQRLRSRDLYRLFYGAAGLSVYFGRRDPECTLIEYDHPVRCAATVEEETGEERFFFGSDDGWVFEAEKGTSFDGEEIAALARIPYNHLGSASHSARLFKVDLHAEVQGRATVQVGASFDYGSDDVGFLTSKTLLGGGAQWGEDEWADFYWGAPLASIGQYHLSGIGPNVSVLFRSDTAEERPHVLSGTTIHYTPRRLIR